MSYDTAQRYAQQSGLKFAETSALTNAHVSEVFDTLLHYIHDVKLSSEGADLLDVEGKKYKKLTEKD